MATTLAYVIGDLRTSRRAAILDDFRTSGQILELFKQGRRGTDDHARPAIGGRSPGGRELPGEHHDAPRLDHVLGPFHPRGFPKRPDVRGEGSAVSIHCRQASSPAGTFGSAKLSGSQYALHMP